MHLNNKHKHILTNHIIIGYTYNTFTMSEFIPNYPWEIFSICLGIAMASQMTMCQISCSMIKILKSYTLKTETRESIFSLKGYVCWVLCYFFAKVEISYLNNHIYNIILGLKTSMCNILGAVQYIYIYMYIYIYKYIYISKTSKTHLKISYH